MMRQQTSSIPNGNYPKKEVMMPHPIFKTISYIHVLFEFPVFLKRSAVKRVQIDTV